MCLGLPQVRATLGTLGMIRAQTLQLQIGLLRYRRYIMLLVYPPGISLDVSN